MGKLGDTPRRRSTALGFVVTALLAAACSLTAADDGARDGGASSTTTVTVVPLQLLPTRGIVSPYTGRPYATQMSAVGGRPPGVACRLAGSPSTRKGAGARVEP